MPSLLRILMEKLNWYSDCRHLEKHFIKLSFGGVVMKKRKSYSKQFKIDAVKLVTEDGYKISEAARNLGVHPVLLGRWKQQIEVEGTEAFPGKGHMTPEIEELYRLRKENKRLRMEREILKRATAFFAKESK